jgi:hypothetical protein
MEDRLIGKDRLQRSVKLTEILRVMLKTKSPAEQITAIARFNETLAQDDRDFNDVEVRLSMSEQMIVRPGVRRDNNILPPTPASE